MSLLSQQQLDTLRANYSRIERIDPASTTYQTLISKLNRYPQEVLRQLADANIKFLSALARNRTKTKMEDASPSSVHSNIIDQLKSEIQQVSTITDDQSYKRAVRQLLVRKPVIPAAQVEQFTRRFLQAYPYSQYRIAKKTGDMRTSQVAERDHREDDEHGGGPTPWQNPDKGWKGVVEGKYDGSKSAPMDKDYEYRIHSKSAQHNSTWQHNSNDVYHSVADAKRIAGNMKKGTNSHVKITRHARAKMAGPQGTLPESAQTVVFTGTGANGVKYEIIKTDSGDFMIHADGRHIDTYGSQQRAMGVLQNEVPGLKRTVESVTEADDTDQDVDASTDGEENPRDIEKEVPSEIDLDWISKFDLGEIKEAIQKIIDHLSNTEDEEQIELLRNDIRILDNLHGALGKKDSAAVDKYWKIAQDSGSHEHLHPEFAKRMDDATSLVSVKEGYVAETVTFKDKAKWDKAAKKYRVKPTGKSETAFCKETGAMMGRWASEKGWLES